MTLRHSTIAEVTNNEERGHLEVRVTLDEVNSFEPTIKILGTSEFPYDYATLLEEGIPPEAFIAAALTGSDTQPAPRSGIQETPWAARPQGSNRDSSS